MRIPALAIAALAAFAPLAQAQEPAISQDQAVEIAEGEGLVTMEEVSFDRDDNKWEVEGRTADGQKIEVDIDAASGTVLDVDLD